MASALSESPQKAIEYVLIFLPGFIALGFTMYMTDLGLGEFAFTFVAIALSLLIGWITNGTITVSKRLAGTKNAQLDDAQATRQETSPPVPAQAIAEIAPTAPPPAA